MNAVEIVSQDGGIQVTYKDGSFMYWFFPGVKEGLVDWNALSGAKEA